MYAVSVSQNRPLQPVHPGQAAGRGEPV